MTDAQRDPVGPLAGERTRDPRDRHQLVGRTLAGRFVIESVIGSGGMGIVYLGHQTNMDRRVAIKVLRSEQTDAETIKRFENEARAASRLSHPNTITVHDFGSENELLFIVMEFLEGESLQQLLKREARLDAVRICRIVVQILGSLGEAHKNGIIHRDIKPDNIFLKTVGADREFVKVLDFGVAKLGEQIRGDAQATRAGMIFGTPRYMSPEQATSKDLDPRSDLYSVGIVMYEALTGRAPFLADDPVTLLIQHVTDTPPTLAEAAPDLDIHPAFEVLLARAMSKDREQRFASAPEMQKAVTDLMVGLTGGYIEPLGSGSWSTHTPLTTTGRAPNTSGPYTGSMGPGPSSLRVDVPVAEPSKEAAHRGLKIAVLLVFALALVGVAYAIIAIPPGPDPSDAGNADGTSLETSAFVDAVPDEVELVDVVDGTSAPPDDQSEVADEQDLDSEEVVDATDDPSSDTADAALDDIAANADSGTPPGGDEVADAPEEAIAATQETDPVWVDLDVEPRRAEISFGDWAFRRDGEYYVFDRALGDSVTANLRAPHRLSRRVTIDLNDIEGDGLVHVHANLPADPCDPFNGNPDPYVCPP